jgi:hypothetical protein
LEEPIVSILYPEDGDGRILRFITIRTTKVSSALGSNRVPLGITGVSDFIHRPDFNNYKKKEQRTKYLLPQ